MLFAVCEAAAGEVKSCVRTMRTVKSYQRQSHCRGVELSSSDQMIPNTCGDDKSHVCRGRYVTEWILLRRTLYGHGGTDTPAGGVFPFFYSSGTNHTPVRAARCYLTAQVIGDRVTPIHMEIRFLN